MTLYFLYTVLLKGKIMLKWIENSKGAVNNKSSKYKGIKLTEKGSYVASVNLRLSEGIGKPKKAKYIYIGTYSSVKEAKNKRIEFILNLL